TIAAHGPLDAAAASPPTSRSRRRRTLVTRTRLTLSPTWIRLGTSLMLLAVLALLPGPARAQSVLRIGLNDDPDALDPTISRAYSGRPLSPAFGATLSDAPPARKSAPQPATGYGGGRGSRSLVIKPRPGVRFHDGEPLNAEAVRFNIERHLNTPGSFRKT